MNTLRTRLKAYGRKQIDRIVRPYVEAIDARIAKSVDGIVVASEPRSLPKDFFHTLLHELRSLELDTVPSDGSRVLSVGASGRWYFDWFEQHVGHFDEHIGVEAFEPKPPDLPDYVTWIEATAGDMPGVEDQSVDLVFAGQTIEHLWEHELIGFLLEAYRVITPGGSFVADSPNRLVSEPMQYGHGGHTVELSAQEFTDALKLAGFDVLASTGIWCSKVNGEIIGLEDDLESPDVLVRRVVEGARRPEDAFIWWITARRSGREPDRDKLQRHIADLFDRYWPWRVSRGISPHGVTSLAMAGPSVEARSLPFPLHPGRWRLSATLSQGAWSEFDTASFEMVAPGDCLIWANVLADASIEGKTAHWEFDCHDHLLAISIHVRSTGGRDTELALPIDLRCTAQPAPGD